MGGHLKRALLLEVAIYVCLLRWVLRRPAVRPREEPVGYAKAVTPVLCLWIFASAAEIPLLHVLLPWHAARVVSIVLGAWGLVWMLGLLASHRVRPHVLDADGSGCATGPGSTYAWRGWTSPRPAPTCRSRCPAGSTCPSGRGPRSRCGHRPVR